MKTSRIENLDPGLGSVAELARLTLDGTDLAIERVLSLARSVLGMDVAFISAFRDGYEVIRDLEGDAGSFGLEVGMEIPLHETYCQRVIDGRLPNVVADTKHEERVADLPVTEAIDLGAYVGVPVRLWDGRLYGTLCCLSHSADPTLNERDLKFMEVLAEVIAEQVERQQLEDAKRQVEAARVREIIEQGDVEMVFQPVFGLDDGALVSFEALARFWREPNRPPSAWFAEAAEVGLGVDLELAAVEAALARLDDLPDGVSLAINVSPATATSPAFRELVLDVAERLVIEVTEHARVDDYDRLVEALAPLRERGAQVAVDDVGAGFASLRHILRLDPDIVKLDLSLTRDIAGDRARAALASSLVEFARDIDATIAAEGIETNADLDLLRELGVGYGQGFYLGRPSALIH